MNAVINKRFGDLPIGAAFYHPGHDQVFTKVSDDQAERRLLNPAKVVAEGIAPGCDIRVWPKQKIFDGRDTVEIDACCNGSVEREDICRATAYRNMVDAPKLISAVLLCKTCGRKLHDIRIT